MSIQASLDASHFHDPHDAVSGFLFINSRLPPPGCRSLPSYAYSRNDYRHGFNKRTGEEALCSAND